MIASPSALWTVQQQAWLTALGHALYVPGAVPRPDELPRAAGERPAPVKVDVPPRTPVRQVPVREPETVAAPSPASARRIPSRVPDRLHFALIRASGCDPNAEGIAQVMAAWPSSQVLRGNPAAKRALWPSLRAMRKTSGS